MDHLITDVVICEQNRTRAELYALWLDQVDAAVALTAREAADAVDEGTAVVVLDQRFAGEKTRNLLSLVRSESPLSRVIETRERSSPFPELGLDHHLVKPVFEAELTDLVGTLLLRANYHLVLRLYYQTTAPLLSLQSQTEPNDAAVEQRERLEARAERLKDVIGTYQAAMSEDDIAAVKDAVNYTPVRKAHDSDTDTGSKYRPDKCSRCREPWNSSPSEGGTRVTRLGAYVWRCGNCGHVQMRADPSHQDVGKFRR
ncbi:response regulator receiver protein [Haloarcula salinisoli]|uniref:Response regulator receiver protein n=1 Tax=Haloarcula salinisoli TaxID=2487746 RepID=A0A8J7YDN5_9EURY|nr:response regulator receiver protein [Halomicroarcula salinisoli]MBX0284935.1 response regulator receiver protein [Halomicroarcula salinisoli]MBX0303587.1 response regulator receiver protein [Halomicroarcula salinisoli]